MTINDEELKELSKQSCEDVISDPNRGRLVFDRGSIISRPLRFLRISGPILTAHHPLCSFFEGHTFTLFGRKWCIGCFFNSLSFFTALPLLLMLWSIYPAFLVRDTLYLWAFVGVAISLAMSAFGLTENKKVKAVAKLLLGGSFALFVVAILITGGSVTTYLVMKGFLIFLVYLPIMTLMNIRRLREIQKTCEACEYKMRWSSCPGFKDLVCAYINEGFLHPTPASKSDS
ncbi:MAG: hypothetical protein ACTSYL_12620 [Candidatus Thorarchaeota archaeon]